MAGNNMSKNVSQKVLQKFLPEFASDLVLTKTIDRQIIANKIDNTTGDSIQIKRPHQFKTEKTKTGDLTGKDPSALVAATATAKVDDYITVYVSWSQLEQALELNQLDKILKPIARTMATELETRVANFMLANGALSIGNAGSGIKEWDEVSRAGALFADMGQPGTKYAALSPWAISALAGKQIALANGDLNRNAWEKAQIPRNFAGLDAVFSTNSLATRTAGQAAGVATLTVKTAPTIDYTSVKDTYQFSVPLTGATASVNGFLKAGDQLVFSATAWVNQMNKQSIIGDSGDIIAFTCTVMADANSDANGNVTVTCSGVPIYDAALPQYNTVAQTVAAGDAVMVRGAKNKLIKPSLFYTDSFMGLATIKLPKLHSIDSSIVNWEGLSIRAHKWSDGTKNNQFMRFDLLPAFACFNPMEGGQLAGGTAA
ncbi:P22 phage major capsid protein family protein [Lelliottia wanjuensis]|uniref:P22 phage major capsid protein family protein n=1 Tax=Lelliottia wanjuensis TaxID=3050585 RepID=UPI00254CE421|nr:P22 phage major capsid protein family protein [Lelliottia sp. V86_10]MDK9585420.1 P22 phage major capsid protein family protein [Lelliottia sp. V86_10]